MKKLTPEEETKVLEMILSSDYQLIRLALTIACNDGEWVYSFRVNTFEDIIDFSRHCMEHRMYPDEYPHYFIYQDRYYKLRPWGGYRSCYAFDEATKEEYESRQNKRNVD